MSRCKLLLAGVSIAVVLAGCASQAGRDAETHGGMDADVSTDIDSSLDDAFGDDGVVGDQSQPDVCEPRNHLVCGSTCVDIREDPNNCGRCDHGCYDAGCYAAACRTNEIRIGAHFLCATLNSLVTECWGSNAGGVLDDSGNPTLPLPVLLYNQPAEFAAGYDNLCFSTTSVGTCRGPNDFGQNGAGMMAHMSRMTVGHGFACGYNSLDGHTYCWGRNDAGQLGNGTTIDSPTPVQVAAVPPLQYVLAGDRHVCGIGTDRSVYCWGARGLIGDGTTDTDRSTPVRILDNQIEMLVGGRHACARAADDVHCWGANDHGQLGDGTMTDAPAPIVVPAFPRAMGQNHSCRIVPRPGANGGNTVECWGADNHGQLGDHRTTDRAVPLPIDFGSEPYSLRAGGDHTCVIDTDQHVYCWGDNSFGELLTGTTDDVLVPNPMGGI